ncbi:Flp family type IVb pilin [Sphingomonas sp. RHCKR7]|uniref:Flp family type IVb pilin n=1 Tax=Sphingomonas folli TaxID=2862497 RepID=UPI001CA5E07B|nr:Flp family type IVb pilin [Sphingomonas folli]MBW6529090.1 Flp family type IVb pilin [Sphingomonas folli]
MFRRLWGNRRGATAIEYGLIAALVAVAAIAAMKGLGNQLSNSYRGTTAKITAAGA